MAKEATQTKPAESAGSETSKSKKGSVLVEFTGSSVITRRISKQDFAKWDVELEDQEWSKSNQHIVDASDWPDAAVERIAKEPGFKVKRPGSQS
jgi:hypothetical protein